jgi:hypothetical protein
VLFFPVKMMESVWKPTLVRQAMAAVVDGVLSYEIPRWCTAIYVKTTATFPNTKQSATRMVLAWFFGVRIPGIGYTEILSSCRMSPRLN